MRVAQVVLALTLSAGTLAKGGQVQLASIPFQPITLFLDFGLPNPEVQVTPWLQYKVLDPNNLQRTTLRFSALTAQPSAIYQLHDSAFDGDPGFELTTFLMDGVTYEGLTIQKIAMGYTIHTNSLQFDLPLIDTFENWVLGTDFTHMNVPRVSPNDLGGYVVDRIDVDILVLVDDEPIPNSGVFYNTTLQVTYSFFGAPVPDPATIFLIGSGSLVILRRRVA
jgi:hypothetical protein